MNDITSIVEAGAQQLSRAAREPVRIGLILGSGLGHIAGEVEGAVTIPAAAIPGYPASTVEGHEGVFVLGRLRGVPAAVLSGRLHAYEGHPPAIAALGARILCRLQPTILVITNAAGGLNRDFRAGDLMLITDHLNLAGRSPLEGPNFAPWGPRFPDLTAVYPTGPRNNFRRHAATLGVEPRQGVYAWLPGPQYETPAEVRMLRVLGADAVGMSTVPEAIVAAHMKVPVLGISLISNLAAGLSGAPLSHDEVLAAAARTGKTLGRILVNSLPDLAAGKY